jgi:2-isopropylmalate synthase
LNPNPRPLIFSGYSVNTDTIVAAAEAYMGALNKMLAARQERIKAEEVAYAAGYDKNAPLYAVDVFGNSLLGQH